jgi:hypothetical protein
MIGSYMHVYFELERNSLGLQNKALRNRDKINGKIGFFSRKVLEWPCQTILSNTHKYSADSAL